MLQLPVLLKDVNMKSVLNAASTVFVRQTFAEVQKEQQVRMKFNYKSMW